MPDLTDTLTAEEIQIPWHQQGDVLTELRIALQDHGVVTIADWKHATKIAREIATLQSHY